MPDLILAIDQGTTGTTVLLVDPAGTILGRGYHEHPQHFPRPGLVEHDPEAIWQSVLDSTRVALSAASAGASDVAAIGITNQRETVVAWHGETGAPVGPTIVWQDRRTAARCADLRAEGHSVRVRELTGLPIDPYFSASKVQWLLEHDDDVRACAAAGSLRIGTIDSWLVHRLSGGAEHVTDATNAARTMLYDIHAAAWSRELCDLFGVEERWLPRVVDSAGACAHADPSCFLGISAPVCGIAGDQQAALFGQACFTPGQAKATYGTGAFVLVNSGANAPATESLISTVAWSVAGTASYALEGSIFTAGASVQWLRDGLQVIDTAAETEALASTVDDPGGVVLVPAFAGLGAPIWDADARAALFGITRGTTRAHVVRATLEAVTFRVRQLVEAMRSEGTSVDELRVDGGMAMNGLVLQLQADVLEVPVVRPTNVETTSLGAAYLAMLGVGVHGSLEDVASIWQADRTFEPQPNEGLQDRFRRFEQAVELVQVFARDRTDPGVGVTG